VWFCSAAGELVKAFDNDLIGRLHDANESFLMEANQKRRLLVERRGLAPEDELEQHSRRSSRPVAMANLAT